MDPPPKSGGWRGRVRVGWFFDVFVVELASSGDRRDAEAEVVMVV